MLRDLEAREAVQDDRIVVGAEAQDLHHPRDRADVVEILEAGFVRLGVALADDPHHGPLMSYEILDQPDATWAADVDGHDARWKDHAVAER